MNLMQAISSMLKYDPFEGIPTEEEWLAIRAYKNLLVATRTLEEPKRTKTRIRIAKNLIKNETDHKMAVEFYHMFQRKFPGIDEKPINTLKKFS